MGNRAVILSGLAAARKLPFGQMYFAMTCEPPPTSGLSYSPFSRLIVILDGHKKAELPLLTGRKLLELNKGDVIYCLPGSWENQDWRGNYRMMCVVPRHDFLRVSLYERNDFEDRSWPEPYFIHTGLPYSDVMRNTIKALNASAEIGDRVVIDDLCKALLGLAEAECRRKMSSHARPEQLFNRIRNWVDKSFQEDISRELAAKVFNISPGYVSMLFKKCSGISFQNYLTQCRMDSARKLLKETGLTVYQVADCSGYRNYVHFVRRFREINGMTPGEFREKLNDLQSDG